MSHRWMSHVTHTNESCHAQAWVMSRIWMSHVTQNESCHAYACVVLHVSMISVTHTHMWMIHVTHMNESRHKYEWVMSHIWMSHVTHNLTSATPNPRCHGPLPPPPMHLGMSHVTHMNESCHAYEWVMSHIWMSHSYAWNDSFIYEWHDSLYIYDIYE